MAFFAGTVTSCEPGRDVPRPGATRLTSRTIVCMGGRQSTLVDIDISRLDRPVNVAAVG